MNGSSRRKPRRRKDEFTNLFLSRTLDEIFNVNLYRSQVKTIPASFESADQYLGSYINPLLEEARAELASSLETVRRAPFAKVLSLEKCNSLYEVRVGGWRNETSDRGKEPYRTMPGDFVLLSEMKPEKASDLHIEGMWYTLALVKSIPESGSDGFTIKTARNFEAGDQQEKQLFVVYLMNMTTNERIWNALKMRKNLMIIEKVLGKNVMADEDCELCPLKCLSEVETNLLSKINESQHKAILASMTKTGCNHKSSVELVWGPPGTGKTTTLSILLYILLRLNVRTLVCAPSNTAITELASRVTALVRNSVEVESGSCPLGEMLIFGNKDRLNIGSDIEDIFLDYRVESLIHCLGPHIGWKHSIASMLSFLEDCVFQHQILEENEVMESRSFLEFARDRFTNTAPRLRSCVLTLITHLPRSFILEENYERVVQLISLLDSLKMALFEDSCLQSDDAEAIFLQQVTIDSEPVVGTTSLQYIRSQCTFILRSLEASLSELGFPNVGDETSTMNFCFQKASMIFCTVSSSYKLHSVNMKEFHVLAIDEAAQVKECETAIALQIPNVRHAILVGDEMQLPALVCSKLSEEANFGRSLFERLSSMGHSKHLLNVQYRMHPSISVFPNSNFYSNQIKDASNVQRMSYEKTYLQGRMFGPYSFINIPGAVEETDDVGHSKRNMEEVAVIENLVEKLFKECNRSKEKLSIGLISPYAYQVAAIKNKLQSKYDNHKRFTIKINSVDGFQGGEEDIIIISTVRSNTSGTIGFLSNRQRANVALTRARHCLWILGSETTLNRRGSVWATLVSDAKDRHCFFNTPDDHDGFNTLFEQVDDLRFRDSLSIFFKTSRWKILFSSNFGKSFCKLKRNSKMLVISLLTQLAGGWQPNETTVEVKCKNSAYKVKQFDVDAYSVVCSIDIIKDSIYTQALQVWDVLPKTSTTKLLEHLDSIFSMYTDDFISLCKDKLIERNLVVPKTWSISCDISRFKKEEVAEHMSILATAVGWVTNQRTLCSKYKDLSCDATRIVEKVNTLSSLFCTRAFDFEALSKMKELEERLEAWQSELDKQLKVLDDSNAKPNPINHVAASSSSHTKENKMKQKMETKVWVIRSDNRRQSDGASSSKNYL